MRRKTRQIHVGDVLIGGDAPVVVQSMTTMYTRDVDASVAQIKRLECRRLPSRYVLGRGRRQHPSTHCTSGEFAARSAMPAMAARPASSEMYWLTARRHDDSVR